MTETLDFGAIFKTLAETGERRRTTVAGGVDVQCVRVEGGAEGFWDSHPHSPETVLVWSGAFDVAFRDSAVSLGQGQGCVIPAGVEHKGSSPSGAEVVLFKTATL